MKIQRFLEMLPGMMAWFIILFPLWGAIFIPKIVAYFTVGFLVFWLYKSFQSAFLGVKGYLKIRRSEKINWHQKYLQNKTEDSFKWKEIKHLIIIPNVNESVGKISTTLDHLANQKDIDKNQLVVVLAMEERVIDAHQRAKTLLDKYQDQFGKMLATFHPSNLIGEIIGKASNETWAAKFVKKTVIPKEKYDFDKMTITTCDADACFHPKYFSALTYHFATSKKRYWQFWQSPILMNKNFWKVPGFTRITLTLSNIIFIASLQEPDHLSFNYSTYSASLRLLDEVGYWHTDIIPEDWHIFLQCFFHKQGKVEVEPIFLPTNADAPEGTTYWRALKSRYEQCRRHAWGATDIPYAIKESFQHPEIPLAARFFRIYKILESHIIWSTNWFILTLGAWLPALINPVFKQTALGYNLPKVSQIILTACLISLAVIIILDSLLRSEKTKIPRWKYVLHYTQWVFMPIASLFMSVIPGLDAQTRLMLGKRLEYKVTEKI